MDIYTLNEKAFFYLNNFAGQNLVNDSIIIFLANDLGYILLFAFVYFLIKHKDKKQGSREVAMIVTTAIAAWFVAKIYKYVFPSMRPFERLDGEMVKLFDHGGNDSFPSGHATFFSALAMATYFYHKKIALLLGIGAIVIGVTRIISGVHFPIDILGGFFLGVGIALTSYFFWKRK